MKTKENNTEVQGTESVTTEKTTRKVSVSSTLTGFGKNVENLYTAKLITEEKYKELKELSINLKKAWIGLEMEL